MQGRNLTTFHLYHTLARAPDLPPPALEALRADLYDIVVMEWNTAPMTGLQFIDYIRTSPVSPNRLMPTTLTSMVTRRLMAGELKRGDRA